MSTRPDKIAPPPEYIWMVGKTFEEITAIRDEAKTIGKTPEEVLKSDSWKKRIKKIRR